MKISIYAPYAKERFETALDHSILHPERIVGNPKVVGTHDHEISTGNVGISVRTIVYGHQPVSLAQLGGLLA